MESIKVIRKYEKEVQNIQEGDQILISLAEIGEFTATAYKVTDKGVLFIFDEYVASQPMNNKNTNKGGFEKSDLKKWMDSVAGVVSYGDANYGSASDSSGVRPAFLLVKEKSGGRVPHNSRVSYKRYYAHGRQDEISKESLMREINEKVNEIDILKQEIERLDKEHQYDEGISEINALMDSFIRAGFTEGQAFHMVMNMLTTMLGGLR